MAIESPFVWGKSGTKLTPEELEKRREVEEALLAKGVDTSPVGHWSQGLARVANAAAGSFRRGRLDRAGEDIADTNKGLIANLLSGNLTPTASPAIPTTSAASMTPSPVATGGVDPAQLREGLMARGLPEQVADGFIMNFQDESGLNPGINEQNPTVPGSRGGYGLYQLTGPRRVAYENFAQQKGVDPANVDAQLDFLVSELQGPEAAAAQSILAAPDAGTAAAAIAKNFLRPAKEHLDSRIAKYTSGGQAPVQVASLDPSIGMGQPLPVAAQGIGGVAHEQVPPVFTPEQAQVAAAQLQQPQQANPVAQALVQGGLSPQGMAAHDQALGGILAPSGTPQAGAALDGYFPPAPDANRPAITQQSQGINPAIIEALTNQQATPQTQRMAALLLEQQQRREESAFEAQQKANDPMRRLQLEKGQLEIDALRNPGVDGVAVGNKIVDRKTGKVVYEAPESPKSPELVDIYDDQTGQPYKAQWNPQTRQFDRVGGIKAPSGTSLSVSPDGQVSFTQGGANPLTENQSKLTLFQSLQNETQPVLLDLEKQWDPTNLQDAAARSSPIAGNFFKSEQGQIYDSAATAWAEGALRIATGAAATPEEMERTKKAYFAQPGDTPNTIAFKAQMREMYNRSIDRSLGKKDAAGSLPNPSAFAKKFDDEENGTIKTDIPGVIIRRKN